ncbi:hypothetical protein, partial [Lysobacter sp. Root690]|uniref:hypothetical protein n=1 Tax=Lysobacter sp. Root690 TaxID=1736588 RepID=UPI001F47540A
SGFGIRDSGIGNRESGIGNRESGIGCGAAFLPSFPRRRFRFSWVQLNIQSLQRDPSRPSFPRRRESRDFSAIFQAVIPAKAGIQ